jgi:hypothetical protein
MAERTQDIFKRQLISFNSNFRIDAGNPQMGETGTDVYKIYGVNNDGSNQSSISLSSSGFMSIYNDNVLQICAGEKLQGKNNESVVIIGRNGNVSISADDGIVRIKGENIMFEADEDIQFKAGRNVDINSGAGRILLQGNKIDYDAPTGNLIDDLGKGFTQKVFEGSRVGEDKLEGALGDSNPTFNKIVDTALGFLGLGL